ncbi:CoA transferase [Dactylosporangium sp. CA-092794]|uniref:CoA transferase n=1 Tax=Dactylosporangium sp. CA-092794 TaxID=3239929 RepID=UPI003D8ECC52
MTDRVTFTLACGAGADGTACAVLDWARSGAMALTGHPDGPPLAPLGPVAGRVTAVVAALADATARWGRRVDLDTGSLLSARAGEQGWTRGGGRTSANGSARLLGAPDGWIAVNLSRSYDLEVLPAVLGRPIETANAWAALADLAGTRPAREVVAALQEIGIPAAVLGEAAGRAPVRWLRVGRPASRRRRPPVVVDFSAMWAGPLAARILSRAGATVVKVEDVRRPDGARFGPPRFWAQLHHGQRIVRLDFGSPSGQQDLRELVAGADVVVEASRPRALRRLGLIAEEFVADRPGRTWLSITGYGRTAECEHRVAFGDDAAVAGALVAWDGAGRPVFCGDAIADPLTGLYAAAAAVRSQLSGGGHLLDVAMAGVCAGIGASGADPPRRHEVWRRGTGWVVTHEEAAEAEVAPPAAGPLFTGASTED